MWYGTRAGRSTVGGTHFVGSASGVAIVQLSSVTVIDPICATAELRPVCLLSTDCRTDSTAAKGFSSFSSSQSECCGRLPDYSEIHSVPFISAALFRLLCLGEELVASVPAIHPRPEEPRATHGTAAQDSARK